MVNLNVARSPAAISAVEVETADFVEHLRVLLQKLFDLAGAESAVPFKRIVLSLKQTTLTRGVGLVIIRLLRQRVEHASGGSVTQCFSEPVHLVR